MWKCRKCGYSCPDNEKFCRRCGTKAPDLAEEARRAEAERRAEEARKAEAARRAEEERKAEEARKAEETRRVVETEEEPSKSSCFIFGMVVIICLVLGITAISNTNKQDKKDVKLPASTSQQQKTSTSWSNVVDLQLASGTVVALRDDGTVITRTAEKSGLSAANNWQDIKQISLSDTHLVAVDAHGNAFAVNVGSDERFNLDGFENWPQMSYVVAAQDAVYGVDTKGRLHFAGDARAYPYHEFVENYAWFFIGENKNAVSLADLGEYKALVYDMTDGQFRDIFSKEFENKRTLAEYLDAWTHIQALASDNSTLLGVNYEGRYSVSGNYSYSVPELKGEKVVSVSFGPKSVPMLVTESGAVHLCKPIGNTSVNTSWLSDQLSEGVRQIDGGKGHVVALKLDGSVVASGDSSSGQCRVSSWKNVVKVVAFDNASFGISADGKIYAVGEMNWGGKTVKVG